MINRGLSTIVYYPLSNTHRIGMILDDSQIIHHTGSRHHLPARHFPIAPIRPQDMHPKLDLTDRHKPFLLGEEWVFLVGMDYFARLGGDLAMLSWRSRRQGQIDQVVIMVEPDMLDRFQFHLVHLRIVGPHLLSHFERIDRLFSMLGGDLGV